MNPGDIVEWRYNDDLTPVPRDVMLWSCTRVPRGPTMRGWVSIGEPSLVIAADGENFTWMNSHGIFDAKILDCVSSTIDRVKTSHHGTVRRLVTPYAVVPHDHR